MAPLIPHLHGGFFCFGFFSAGSHLASLLDEVVSLFCIVLKTERFKIFLNNYIFLRSFEMKSFQQHCWGQNSPPAPRSLPWQRRAGQRARVIQKQVFTMFSGQNLCMGLNNWGWVAARPCVAAWAVGMATPACLSASSVGCGSRGWGSWEGGEEHRLLKGKAFTRPSSALIQNNYSFFC